MNQPLTDRQLSEIEQHARWPGVASTPLSEDILALVAEIRRFRQTLPPPTPPAQPLPFRNDDLEVYRRSDNGADIGEVTGPGVRP